MKEQAGPQLYKAQISDSDLELDYLAEGYIKDGVPWFDKVRLMRRDPTIALVRSLITAMILSPGWSIESDEDVPEDAVDFIREHYFPQRTQLLRAATLGCVDFGWQGFEKIHKQDSQGRLYTAKFKPLLQDLTRIRALKDTGDFYGFFQEANEHKEEDVNIDLQYALLFNFDVEGTYHYGSSLLANVEDPFDRTAAIADAAERYDRKIAGAHWVIHYPAGTTEVNGAEMSNYEFSLRILNMLRSSGGVVIPSTVKDYIDGLQGDDKESAWKIEILDASSSASAGFSDRLNYLDKQKVRGLGFLERALLEGQYGTKAEAGEHADMSIRNVELRAEELAQTINWHSVNQVLAFNWGPDFENKVRLVSNPVADVERQRLVNIYEKILANPQGIFEELEALDLNAIRERIGVPIGGTEDEVPSLEEIANAL